jgi:hypothetical protein
MGKPEWKTSPARGPFACPHVRSRRFSVFEQMEKRR